MANLFRFIELEYDKLSEQINTWLKGSHSKSDINFSPASPFGQVVELQKELFQNNMVYIKNSVNQINMEDSINKKIINNTARISGANPSRAISATGSLTFKVKPNINIQEEIKDSILIINDNTVLKNKSNNLYYTIKLGVEQNRYNITPNSNFSVNIVQGKFDKTKFTGDGARNQTFRINPQNNTEVENFNITVKYNGISLEIRDSLYDMLSGEFACYIRTSFNGGVDVLFGTENNGFIPMIGSVIEVQYLVSDGSLGDIMNNINNDWKEISDMVTDNRGNIISIDKLFDIYIETPINFSADSEDYRMTKALIPYISRNFVLASPDQFIYHLKRLNMFSKVFAFNTLEDNDYSISEEIVDNAAMKIKKLVSSNENRDIILSQVDNFLALYAKYKTTTNDNVIYLYLIPDIRKYFNDNINYFNAPFDIFYLDDNEKTKVLSYLKQAGTMSPATRVEILQPVISRYVIHIYIRRYSNILEETIKTNVLSSVSDYLLTYDRLDRIPKSALISIIKNTNGVDSASVSFVSKKNEDYHKKLLDNGKPDDKTILGLDPVYGDIVIDKNEYAVIRGGWRDRNGIWYNENPLSNSLSSINITFNGITEI